MHPIPVQLASSASFCSGRRGLPGSCR